MDKSLIRLEPFLGGNKTIIGNKSSDIVLETLGKVYIKFGSNLKLLNDLFSLLEKSSNDVQTLKDNIIIANSYSELLSSDYPGDGYFGFDKLQQILYLSCDGIWIPLVNATDFTSGNYVKKTGDSMTGQLEIRTMEAPLIVVSSSLVKNFNSEYLDGYSSNEFAKKREDETISGNWSYTGENTFKKTTRQQGDLICYKNIGSPEFVSGYNGYGWRFDSTTNTLTIDNLVVRKILNVYELVVNQIRATNGSLWVTNSAECKEFYYVKYYDSATSPASLETDAYYVFERNNCCILYISTSFNIDNFEIEYSEYLKENDAPVDRLEYLYNKVKGTSTETSGSSYDCIWADYSTSMANINTANMVIYDQGIMQDRNLYNYYFGIKDNYRIVEFDDYPVFKAGDLVRCQKFDGGNVKYYDALIITYIKNNTYLLELSKSFNDNYSVINSDGNISTNPNTIMYNKGSVDVTNDEGKNEVLGGISKGDDIVQIGNIFDTDRQGSIYITSTDDQGPYLEVLDEVYRPDYSVLVPIPDFIKVSDGDYKGCYAVLFGTPDTPSGSINTRPVLLYKDRNVLTTEVIDGSIPNYYVLYKRPNNKCLVSTDNDGNILATYHKPSKVRLGKLSGIYNPIFNSNQPTGYGLYGENVFLTGEFFLNNGKSVVEFSKEQVSIMYGDAGMKIVDGKIQFDAGIIDLDFSAESIGEKTKVEFSNGTMKFYHEDSTKKDLVSGDKIIYDPENDKTWVKSIYLGYGKPKEDMAEEPLLIFCDNDGNDLYNIGPSGMFSSEVKSPKVILSTLEKKVFKPSGEFDIKNNFSGKFGEDLNYFFIYSGNNDVQKRSPISVCNPDGTNLFQYPIYVIGSTSETQLYSALIFESVNAISADAAANNPEIIPELTYTQGSDSATKISPFVHYSCKTVPIKFFSIENIHIPDDGYPKSSLFPPVPGSDNTYHYANNFIGKSPFVLYSNVEKIDDSFNFSEDRHILLTYDKPPTIIKDYCEVFWNIVDSTEPITLTPKSSENARAEEIIRDTIGLLSDIFVNAIGSDAVDYNFSLNNNIASTHAYYKCPKIGGVGFNTARYLDSLNIFENMYEILMNTTSNKETTLDNAKLELLGKFIPADNKNIIKYSNSAYSLISEPLTKANINLTEGTFNVGNSESITITKTNYAATVNTKKLELEGTSTNYGSLSSSGSLNNTMLINIGIYYNNDKYCICYDCGEDLDNFYTLWTNNSVNIGDN